jgi:hypothetical protein
MVHLLLLVFTFAASAAPPPVAVGVGIGGGVQVDERLPAPNIDLLTSGASGADGVGLLGRAA